MHGHSPHTPPRLIVGVLHPIAERALNWSAALAPVALPALLLGGFYFVVQGQGVGAVVALLLAAGVALSAWMHHVGARRLTTRRLAIDTGGRAAALRLAFVSDFHLGRYKDARWLARVVAAVNAEQPDVVLLGGDFFFNRPPIDAPRLLAPLSDLRAPLGVLAVYGNHDLGLPGRNRRAELDALLPTLGVRPLRNQVVGLRAAERTGAQTWVAGMGELWEEDFAMSTVRDAYTRDGDDGPLIVLGHNPDALDTLRDGDTADLFLFGHTHAGQIYLPFWPGFGIPIRGKRYRGEHRVAQGRAYITSGVGETSSSARLGTTCEVVVIEVS